MWQDLTRPIEETMPYSEAFDELGTPPRLEYVMTHEEDGASVGYYSLLTHIGTHIDAPLHFVPDGRTIDDYPLEKFAGPGVCLDVSQVEAAEISLAEIQEAEGEIREGDIVLLSTGWEEKYGTDDYDPHPWLADEVAEWFVDRGIDLVALDAITPDLPGPKRPEGWTEYPVHRELLGNEVLIAENLTGLANLAGQRLEVIAFPLAIRDGDGAQARIAARPA